MNRYNIKVFIPNTADVYDMFAIVDWGKDAKYLGYSEIGEGVDFELYIKEEYIEEVERMLSTIGGKVIDKINVGDPIIGLSNFIFYVKNKGELKNE